ncbi:uridylate-specific endoribonuclease B isoform X2 [Hydra vulgaris]|uniref:Uridylate-specific endoribonuclease n=1 Tax=Hydra vulgaris TaxID=6087 RepID=A0ABM4D733_HYDVU
MKFHFILCIFFAVVCDGVHLQKPQKKSNNPPQDQQLLLLLNKLWQLDKNRLVYGREIQISVQGRVSWNENAVADLATRPLFGNINSLVLEKPTFKAFIKLLDNYCKNIGENELITNTELFEKEEFLRLILESETMKEVYKFLKLKGKVGNSLNDFRQRLDELWFKPYYRKASTKIEDSSGFEHVFVGEIDAASQKVSGFHSWIQMYLEEKKNDLNYLGYLKQGNSSSILMSRFKWHNSVKSLGSMFIGTSPEYEIAVYTAIFLMEYSDFRFMINGTPVKVTCFGINRGKSIGTCYPDVL